MRAHLVFNDGLEMGTYAFDINLANDENPTGLVLSSFEPDKDGNTRTSPEILPALTVAAMNNINGRILTIIDAVSHDETVRNATKDLIKKEIWGWYGGLHEGIARAYHADTAEDEE